MARLGAHLATCQVGLSCRYLVFMRFVLGLRSFLFNILNFDETQPPVVSSCSLLVWPRFARNGALDYRYSRLLSKSLPCCLTEETKVVIFAQGIKLAHQVHSYARAILGHSASYPQCPRLPNQVGGVVPHACRCGS